MKQWIILTFLMLIISLGLISYHWWGYQNITAEEDLRPNAEVNMYELDDGVKVNLNIHESNNNELIINMPKEATNLNCTYNAEEVCEIDDGNIKMNQFEHLELSYKLPFNQEDRVLWDWMPKIFQQDEQIFFKINLSMTSPIDEEWSWYTSKEPEYSELLERIHYQEWEFDQQSSIPLVKSTAQYEAVYEQEHQTLILSHIPFKVDPFIDLLETFKVENQVFIINPDESSSYKPGVSIINYTEKRKIASGLLETTIKKELANQHEQDQNLINTLKALFFNMDVNSETGSYLSNQLSSNLSQEQKDQWLNAIIDNENSINHLAKYLDQSLGEVGISTTFFEENISNSNNIPFYQFDYRKIVLNGDSTDWQSILYKGSSYLPLKEIINETDLTFSEVDQNEYLITYDDIRVRVYPGRNLYIANEARYESTEKLLVDFGDKQYIHAKVISEFFPFTITNREIRISN